MKRFLVFCAFFLAFGCSTDDRFDKNQDHDHDGKTKDASVDAAEPANVCELSKCPRPETGVACCTPLAQCGSDPSGIGLSCVPNAGNAGSDLVCALSDCPEPTVGSRCCTPFAQCGFDPFASGLFCFANPTAVNNPDGTDAGTTCDLDKCAAADGGPKACCLANGDCGVDTWGVGICFLPPPPPVDAAVPPVSTEPPDDPSVTGECPSYLGAFGPVWGCCSDFGVCGTFANDNCLLPVGTQIPVPADDEDGGALVYPRCTPPASTPN